MTLRSVSSLFSTVHGENVLREQEGFNFSEMHHEIATECGSAIRGGVVTACGACPEKAALDQPRCSYENIGTSGPLEHYVSSAQACGESATHCPSSADTLG